LYRVKYQFGIYLIALFSIFISVPSAFAEEDTLDKVLKSGVLKWGSDAESGAPYTFFDPKNPSQLIGFEVEMMNLISKKLKVKNQMVQNEWDALIPGLKRGNFDIAIAGIEITDNRKREVNFTRPYYIYSEQMAVRKDYNEINKPEDLVGKNVGTLSGSVAYRMLVNMEGVNYKTYSSIVGSYKDLEAGRTECVLLDLPIASYYAKPNPKLKFAGKPFGTGYYGIAVRKEDERLLSKLNEIISEMQKNGQLEDIYTKWGIWTEAQNALIDYKEKKEETTDNVISFEVRKQQLGLLLKASLVTLKICFLSMFFAVALGLSLAIIRIYAPTPFRFLAAAYVEVMRGTPLLIQLYIIYYGLPEVGIRLEAFTAAILGLSLNYAAYESENYRAGINSIPKGQMEAALALGMTRNMALKRIIIPQAIRVVIPPVTNDFIAMFKDSSIVSVITMVELTKQYNYLASVTYDYIGLGLMTAAIYFFMSYPASMFTRSIEKRLQKGR
jgi:polar amino acid transport system substrate-binding protein